MQRRIPSFIAFVAGCLLTAVGFSVFAGERLPGGGKQTLVRALESAPSTARGGGDTSFVRTAAAKLEPAVVDVHTQGRAEEPSGNPFFGDPFFRQFFGAPRGGGGEDGGGSSERMVPKGAGSGVIISPDGYILTNNHVVADTAKVTVKVGDRGYDATVVGADPTTDIAVVKINPKGDKLTVAELGNSDDVHVGDWAIAIGNPLDIGTTVTLGIISAVNRSGLSAEGHPLQSVIQTDAAINPGNSGGALANAQGQLIGINEAIASPTGAYVGIGFAIPINSARKIAAELIKNGKISRPYLGVAYQPLKAVPPDARAQIGIQVKGDDGVVVEQVYANSPAEEAGLQVYDVILEANRQKIKDTDSLNKMVQDSKVGDKITMLISRNGANQIITATLKERPSNFGSAPERPRRQQRSIPVP